MRRVPDCETCLGDFGVIRELWFVSKKIGIKEGESGFWVVSIGKRCIGAWVNAGEMLIFGGREEQK